MARKPRLEFLGGLYHVINRGNNRLPIFHNDSDYQTFIDSIKVTQKRYPFKCYGFTLMPNHFHLLIETVNESLATIIKSILTRYARLYNIKYKKIGHVFQGRYRAILCQKDKYLWALIRYIHLNPVRALIVADTAQWKWSSYGDYIGLKKTIDIDIKLVLSTFDKNLSLARKHFINFINEGIKETNNFYPYTKEKFPILGDKEFINYINNNYVELRRKVNPELRLTLEQLNERITREFKLAKDEIRSASRDRISSLARSLFCYMGNKYCDYSLTKLAVYLNISVSAVTKCIRRIKSMGERNNINDRINNIIQGKTTSQKVKCVP